MLREVVTTTTAHIADLLAENDKLRLLIQRLSRHQFGSRSEQLSPDQLQIELGTADPAGAGQQAEADTAMPANDDPKPPRPPRPRRNLGALPAHLPRYEVVIDVADRDCPCCRWRPGSASIWRSSLGAWPWPSGVGA